MIDVKQVPIEIRELKHPDKKQAQGMIQMWCEVMTIEEGRKNPITKLGGSHKDDYEIRLIVWETLDVPLNGGA
jgi:hypothetical protein